MATNNDNITKTEMASLSLDVGRLKEEIGNVFGDDEKSKGKFISEIEAFIKDPRIETKRSGIGRLEQILSSNKNLGNNTYVQMTAKKFYLTVDKIIEQHAGEVKALREETFGKNFDKELVEKNPSLNETKLKSAGEYRDLVSKNSFDKSIIDGQQNIALENNDPVFGPGKLENAWMDLKTTVNFLQKSPEEIKSIKEKYNSLKGKLDGVNLPSGSKEARSFERVMSVLNNPNADDLFSRTRKYLGWADRVDKLTGGWLNKTVTDAGVKVFEKIGNQAIQEFTTNALGQMAEHGFQQGFSNVLNGILSGGVKKGVEFGVKTGAEMGAKAVVQTGAKVAVKVGAELGTEAVAGTVGGAATGGILTIAMIALEAVKAIKKAGNAIAEKLGISSKKFLEENFGKVGGFFIKTATMMVAVPAALVGAITATTIGPIVIMVIVGLVGYQIFQSGLISSLMPPKGATSTTSTTVDIPVAAVGNYDITDGTEVKTCNGGEIVVPTVPANFSRQDLYNVAMSLVGKVPYFWAGGYSAKGADPGWNKTLKTVYCSGNAWNDPVHYSCGQKIPSGVDCSGYVLWIYYQLVGYDISDHSSGSMYGKAESGTDGWRFVSESELKVGDIGWKSGHVGIFAGRNTNREKMFIHAWNVEGCMGKTVYNQFDYFIRPNVKFSDD